jgi:hypothetical protein
MNMESMATRSQATDFVGDIASDTRILEVHDSSHSALSLRSSIARLSIGANMAAGLDNGGI